MLVGLRQSDTRTVLRLVLPRGATAVTVAWSSPTEVRACCSTPHGSGRAQFLAHMAQVTMRWHGDDGWLRVLLDRPHVTASGTVTAVDNDGGGGGSGGGVREGHWVCVLERVASAPLGDAVDWETSLDTRGTAAFLTVPAVREGVAQMQRAHDPWRAA
jgi:hypothetical protein